MRGSCLVPARGNQLFGAIPNVDKEDLYVEFVYIMNDGEARRAKLDVAQVQEVAEILRAFLAAPVRQKE
jgi:hypothetical protein